MHRLPLHWTGTGWLRIAILLTAGCMLLGTTACRRGEFDSAQWKAQTALPQEERKLNQMLFSLEKVLHPGMPRSAVIELLGPPDGSDEHQTSDTYALGRAPYGIDPEYLTIEYENGKLVRTRMWRG